MAWFDLSARLSAAASAPVAVVSGHLLTWAVIVGLGSLASLLKWDIHRAGGIAAWRKKLSASRTHAAEQKNIRKVEEAKRRRRVARINRSIERDRARAREERARDRRAEDDSADKAGAA